MIDVGTMLRDFARYGGRFYYEVSDDFPSWTEDVDAPIPRSNTRVADHRDLVFALREMTKDRDALLTQQRWLVEYLSQAFRETDKDKRLKALEKIFHAFADDIFTRDAMFERADIHKSNPFSYTAKRVLRW